MSPVSSASRGFTLVEVMVALMIMSIIAVMAWQGVDGIVRTREASQARLEQTLRLNAVLGQFEHDLQAIQQTTAVPGIAFDGATLRLTRRAQDGLQVVTWSLRPDADGVAHAWLRWASPPARTRTELQEIWFQTQQFQGAEPGQLRALGGIARWQVYCWSSVTNSLSNCQSTGDIEEPEPSVPAPPAGPASGASDAAGDGGAAAAEAAARAQQARQMLLPSGLRVVLDFAGGGFTGTLTRDIAIGP